MRVLLERSAQRPAGVPWYYFEWTTFGADGQPTVHLASWQPPGLRRRVWHALEHALDRSFTNAQHHKSLLGLVGDVRSVALYRFPVGAKASSQAQADELLQVDWLDEG